jgi:hypothetical protein
MERFNLDQLQTSFTHTSLDVLTLALEKTSLHDNLENNLSLSTKSLKKTKHISKLASWKPFSIETLKSSLFKSTTE